MSWSVWMVLHTTNYSCTHEGYGKVVSVRILVCPHYGEAKGQHLVSLITRVCGELLNSNILAVPWINRRHASLKATKYCQVLQMLGFKVK